MFYDILDKKRLEILPLLKAFQNDYYLAGGTALALQIGHRDSVDFDFFCTNEFETQILMDSCKKIFIDHKILKVQDESNTLTIIVDDDIKISFFSYNYTLLDPLIIEEYMTLASTNDIACMKLSAITSRSTLKDYVDLYEILQQKDLHELLQQIPQKFPTLDTNLILKSLVYFDDIVDEPILFKHGKNISLNTIKEFLIAEVKKLA